MYDDLGRHGASYMEHAEQAADGEKTEDRRQKSEDRRQKRDNRNDIKSIRSFTRRHIIIYNIT